MNAMRYAYQVSAILLSLTFCYSTNANAWSDTLIGFRYGSGFTEPNNTRDIHRNVLQFTHVSGDSTGQHFVNIDVLDSDRNDRDRGGHDGATEVYAIYRYQWYLGRPFGIDFGDGPLKEIALTLGAEANTKNTRFEPRKRLLTIGPTFKFDVPGFWDVSLFYGYETNHCGLPACDLAGNSDAINFDPYWIVNSAWKINFGTETVPLKFQGFINYATPKGRDYFARRTAPETLSRSSVMLDVGKILWDTKNQFWLGVGYEYWRNKFGNHGVPGDFTQTPTFQAEWHFN